MNEFDIETAKGLRVLAEAEAYVSALDRTVLGRFAVDREVLMLRIAQRNLLKIMWGFNAGMELHNLDKDITNRISARMDVITPINGNIFLELCGEVNFWLDDAIQPAEEIKQWTDKLVTVSQHPESFHEYFLAGIWDTALIAKYVADDVDPEMVLHLEAS